MPVLEKRGKPETAGTHPTSPPQARVPHTPSANKQHTLSVHGRQPRPNSAGQKVGGPTLQDTPGSPVEATATSCLPVTRPQTASSLRPVFLLSPGAQYWIYNGERRVSGPLPTTELGLSASPVQAALMWGLEKYKIYFFKGGSYWRFNPRTHQVDNIHPRRMADWRGIPQEVDAAFQDELGEFGEGLGPASEWTSLQQCAVRTLQ